MKEPFKIDRETVNIFILIDALGWDYIKDRPFLDDIAVTKRPVKSILGFSSGVIPSILTGKYPQEHKHWSLYFYSPQTSPFRWTKKWLWLPKKVLNSRIARKIVEDISKRVMGYSGYFETYLIPVEQLHLFDICENKNIYAPKGIRGAESIFDVLHHHNIDYKCFSYPLKDSKIFAQAKNALENSNSAFYFLYLSESDALLHRCCNDKRQIEVMIAYYEREIYSLFTAAKKKCKEVNLYVFSDHGMAVANKGYNLKEEIENLGFRAPGDYVAFYDSTMARFWFFNPETKNAVVNLLKHKEYGRILAEEELSALGIKFENNMYGELVFLMNTGSVICPSYMGSRVPKGMHGFSVDDGMMDAMLVSNQKVEQEINNVKDFFNIMLDNCAHRKPKTTNRIKILYFLNSKVRAGAEEHLLRLIEGLDKAQFEPLLACPWQLIDLMKSDLDKLQIKYYPVYIRRWRNIREIISFLKILKKERPDIVHSHLFFATRFAAPLAKFAGVPKIIETAHLREAWRKGIKKTYFVDRFFYRFVDKIIAVSNAVKKYLVYEKGIPADKIELIHNGVDTERFRPIAQRKNRNNFNIGVIGRLEPQKGHRYFLEAIGMLNGKFTDVRFFIIGEGSLKKDLQQMCLDLKVDDKVEFLGFKRDIVSVLRDLDLVVLPSLYEGLPLVALEAGAMGKPIIATNVDGTPEVVVKDKTGIIIEPGNAFAIKEAIERILNNRNLTDEFGINARKHIEEIFNLKKQIQQTETLYQSLAANKNKGLDNV